MTAVLFVGPSLAPVDPVLPADFVRLPPAGQGDVYRAAKERPRAIGLVDGYFEGVPSVWHKEILWALSRGIAIYGSASMGALRAAELHRHGMIGVGRIFEDYRDGVLDADDEVALLHGPPETGFVALTEPLVNVRATCRAAEAAGVVAGDEARAIVAAANSVFYKERSWREVLDRARAHSIADERLSSFGTWLSHGRVDQKRRDALDMIERMTADLAGGASERRTSEFTPTFLWERAVAGWSQAPVRAGPAPETDQAVLDELRLEPERYALLRTRAGARIQALREAEAAALASGRADRAAVRKRHREAHGLPRAADCDRWLETQRLDHRDYDRLIEEEALVELAGARESPELRRQMVALLKLDGGFAAAAERAATKTAALAGAQGRARPGPLPPVLLGWYFGARLGRPVPEDIDGFARSLGLGSREALYVLLADEYLYSAATGRE